MQKVEYNKPIVVTANQYKIIMYDYAGICAGQDDTLTIKLLLPKYKNLIQSVIDNI